MVRRKGLLSLFCPYSLFLLYLVIPAQDDSTVQQSVWDHIALFVKFSMSLLCTSLVKSMVCIYTTKQQGVKEPSAGTPTLVTGNLGSASVQSAFTHPAPLWYLVTSTVLLETMLSLTQILLPSPSQTLSLWMHQ